MRPGWFVQTHEHPELVGRTLLEILHRGDDHRDGRAGMGREQASRVLDRYELAHAAEQTLRVALGRPAGAVPDPAARAVRGDAAAARRADRQPRRASPPRRSRTGLEAFDGTVLAVTHDRWFARGFDRFLVYGADGEVYESDGPVWDEGRVQRPAQQPVPTRRERLVGTVLSVATGGDRTSSVATGGDRQLSWRPSRG